MMYGHHNHPGLWGWFGFSIGVLLFAALLVAVVVVVMRTLQRDRHDPAAVRVPERILAERYARGEIDEEEYRRRLTTLRAGPAGPPGG